MPDRKVVIVDDEADVRLPLRRFLLGKGYAVLEADSVASVRALLGQESVDAAVVDFSLPDGDGLDVLRSVKAQDASVPVVLLTGHGSIDLAVKAIKEGAEQFFTKPVELPALLVVIERALENRRMRQVSLAGKSVQARHTVDPFFGRERRSSASWPRTRRASSPPPSPCSSAGRRGRGRACSRAGSTRTGRARRRPSSTSTAPACRGTSWRRELFGHEKGAFTGAVAAKPGLLEIAHRGTMFLDEIGDVDLQVQAKLLKVVEDLRYRRLGDVRDRQVDVRLMAATHRDLGRLVQEQKFREDLYYRLSTIPLVVPPLRERGSDVILLARRLVERISAEMGRPGVRLSGRRRAGARSRAPGRATCASCATSSSGPCSSSDHSTCGPADVADAGPAAGPIPAAGVGGRITLAEAERRHIEAVLREERGAVASAAEVLGLSRSALYERIKKFGIVTAKGTES